GEARFILPHPHKKRIKKKNRKERKAFLLLLSKAARYNQNHSFMNEARGKKRQRWIAKKIDRKGREKQLKRKKKRNKFSSLQFAGIKKFSTFALPYSKRLKGDKIDE
ncbi:MAG: hypothetical protein ACNS64_12350, partial [Candidatus Halalkalibacterium sp. M3_1C_030]